jgi:hypothetical protein
MRISDNLKINIDNIDDSCNMINMWFLRPMQGIIFLGCKEKKLFWYGIELKVVPNVK